MINEISKDAVLECIVHNRKHILIEDCKVPAVTFLWVIDSMGVHARSERQKAREVKRMINELISDGLLRLIDGEPPYYVLESDVHEMLKGK